MVEVRNNGVPLLEHAPKAAITAAMQQMANALCSNGTVEQTEEPAENTSNSSWMNFWPSKSKAK